SVSPRSRLATSLFPNRFSCYKPHPRTIRARPISTVPISRRARTPCKPGAERRMEDLKQPVEDAGHGLQAPHWQLAETIGDNAPLIPFRLILRPSGVVVEVTQPD